MVSVITNPDTTGNAGSPGFFMWLGSNWGYFVLAIIVLIAGFVIYFLLKKIEEERQERDDPVYQGYKNILRDCDTHADQDRIQKNWSPINLLWLGLPIVKKEHSARILNYRNETLGFYRGHSFSLDGYLNLLLYKKKVFIFFEERFLLKCPLYLDFKVLKKDEEGKVLTNEDGIKLTTTKRVKYSHLINYIGNGDIKIMCSTIQKISYFRFPVYVDRNEEIIDYRKALQEDIVEIGYDQMISRVLATGSQMVEKAMLHNPNVKYNQLSPEKTKTEQTEDER